MKFNRSSPIFCLQGRRLPREQSSWGQHGAHLGPVGPRWAPCQPHEPCYQGRFIHWKHSENDNTPRPIDQSMHHPLLGPCCPIMRVHMYHKISDIRCTKYQNLNDSHLVLQLPLPSPLKPGVKPKGDAPTPSEWSPILFPTKVRLTLKVWQ